MDYPNLSIRVTKDDKRKLALLRELAVKTLGPYAPVVARTPLAAALDHTISDLERGVITPEALFGLETVPPRPRD